MKIFVLVIIPVLAIAVLQSSEKPSPIRNRVREAGSDTGPNSGIACYYVSNKPLSAVHPSFPIGSRVKVTNLKNQKTVVVTVTSHSALTGRLISLSRDAADQLGFVTDGTTQAAIESLP